MHKIHTPRLVRPGGLASGFAVNRHLAPAGPFGPQTQALFAIQTVDDVLAYLPAVTLQHDMHPPVSETDPRRHDLVHALAECYQRIPRRWLALRRAVLACQVTGPPLRVAV